MREERRQLRCVDGLCFWTGIHRSRRGWWFHGLFLHSAHACFATPVCLHDGRILMPHRIVSLLSVHIMTITTAHGLRKSAQHPIHMAKHLCRMNNTRGPSLLRKVPQNMKHCHRSSMRLQFFRKRHRIPSTRTSCRHWTGVAYDAVACEAVDEFFLLWMTATEGILEPTRRRLPRRLLQETHESVVKENGRQTFKI